MKEDKEVLHKLMKIKTEQSRQGQELKDVRLLLENHLSSHETLLKVFGGILGSFVVALVTLLLHLGGIV